MRASPVDGLENRVDLFVLQVVDGALLRPFEGDAENSLGQVQMFWIPRSQETEECMNGREPDISRRYAVLAFMFKVGEKREDSWWIQIHQVEFRQWLSLAGGEKPQQQHNAVAVTVDSMRTGSTKAGKIVREVVAHHGTKQIGILCPHRCRPFWPSTGTTSLP